MISQSRLAKALVVLSVCFLSSCGVVSNITEKYIAKLTWITFRSDVLTSGEWAYAQVYEGQIWERGDDRVKLEQQIRGTLRIEVDGKPISNDEYILSDVFGPPVYISDSKGNIIGSYGKTMDLYFEVPHEVGIHRATIEVTTTSGKQYSYSWEFAVVADN